MEEIENKNGENRLCGIIDMEMQFSQIVQIITETRNDVFRVANRALIKLYWRIGEYISQRISSAEWGDGVVVQLARYIASNLPEAKGFSDKNLWRMRQFYETYCTANDGIKGLLGQISWTNNLAIMSRCKSTEERCFYLNLSAKENLSSRELDRQISSSLFERTMLDVPKLSAPLREFSSSIQSSFRDRYVLEFLDCKTYSDEFSFKEAIIMKMKEFILEIGKDFVFIAQEYNLQVGNQDFRIDLLFFHRELRCLIAFEIKMGRFKPQDLGQLEFYLEALDRNVKKSHENPSIGILLCKDKDDEVVEYALARSLSPTLIAEYQLKLPNKKVLQAKLRELYNNNIPTE